MTVQPLGFLPNSPTLMIHGQTRMKAGAGPFAALLAGVASIVALRGLRHGRVERGRLHRQSVPDVWRLPLGARRRLVPVGQIRIGAQARPVAAAVR